MTTLVNRKLTGHTTSKRTMRTTQATNYDVRLLLFFCDCWHRCLAVLLLSLLVHELLVKSLMLTKKTASIDTVRALGTAMIAVRLSMESTMRCDV